MITMGKFWGWVDALGAAAQVLMGVVLGGVGLAFAMQCLGAVVSSGVTGSMLQGAVIGSVVAGMGAWLFIAGVAPDGKARGVKGA